LANICERILGGGAVAIPQQLIKFSGEVEKNYYYSGKFRLIGVTSKEIEEV
jgi:hypothetical protein